MENVLKVRNLTKSMSDRNIVDDVSFDINKGEIVGLLGPNGAGKTTIMRMIVSMISISSGEIILDGISIKDNKKEVVARTGSIIENPEFYDYLTGYEILRYYARMYKGIDRKRIDEVIDILKLSNVIDKKVKNFSLGMRQRLGIACSLLHSPKLLILDEPMNGLDPMGIREMREYIKELSHNKGVSVLISSHLLSEIELLCDRTIVIEAGKFVNEIDLINKDNKKAVVIIKTNSSKDSIYELKEDFDVEKIDKYSFKISLEDEEIATIIKRLVEKNISVFRVYEEKTSLEDSFFKLVGGAGIV